MRLKNNNDFLNKLLTYVKSSDKAAYKSLKNVIY